MGQKLVTFYHFRVQQTSTVKASNRGGGVSYCSKLALKSADNKFHYWQRIVHGTLTPTPILEINHIIQKSVLDFWLLRFLQAAAAERAIVRLIL